MKLMKANEICKGLLFQRSNMVRFTEDAKFDLLTANNIQCVVGMACEEDHGFRNLLGKNYLWHPIRDSKIADVSLLKQVTDEACRIHHRTGGAVLTYCLAGRNRSGVISGMILNQVLGISGEDAIDMIRLGRPNTLSNKHFVAYLKTLPSTL